MLPGIMPLIGKSGASVWPGVNNVGASCWMDGAADYLSDTFAATENQTAWTYSVWFRRTDVTQSGARYLVSAGSGGTRLYFSIQPDDSLLIQYSSATNLTAAHKLRDTEYQHLRWVWDTDNASADDRMQVYLNGERVTFSANPTSGLTQGFNTSSASINIGRLVGAGGYFLGGMAQATFLSGDVTSECGEFTTVGTNGQVWTPLSDAAMVALADAAGSNSFCLTTAIGDGTDASANSNNMTANSMTHSANGLTDSPSDPHTIFSMVDKGSSAATHNILENGGTKVDVNKTECLTYVVQPGERIVIEFLLEALNGSTNTLFGIADLLTNLSAELCYNSPGSATGAECYGYFNDGDKGDGPSAGGNKTAYGNTFTDGDRIQLIFDNENGNLFFAKNGTLQNSATSGEIEAGTGTNAAFSSLDTDKTWRICVGNWSSGDSLVEVIGHEDDATDTIYDGFTYARLFTRAGPDEQGIDAFNTLLHTGDDTSSRAVTGAGFQPDIAWFKARLVSGESHRLQDSSRGVGAALSPDVSNVEASETGVISFDSDGLTFGRTGGVGGYNTSGVGYVTWLWKVNGGSTVSNTDGTITGTQQVAEDGSISVTEFSGTGANATIGHGLDEAPACVIVKRVTSTAADWTVWIKGMTGLEYMLLNGTNGLSSHATVWNSTVPGASVVNLGTSGNVNGASSTYIMYAFKNVPGKQFFGEYAGNGIADGEFINLGFKPALAILKSHASVTSWLMQDNKRDTGGNPIINYLFADASAVEGTTTYTVDHLALGLKIRTASAVLNTSNSRYSIMAFAEVAAGVGLPPIPGRF